MTVDEICLRRPDLGDLGDGGPLGEVRDAVAAPRIMIVDAPHALFYRIPHAWCFPFVSWSFSFGEPLWFECLR